MDLELEKFKTEINLAAFIEDMGFTYDPKKSCTNFPAFKGSESNEIFIVSKNKTNNHHLFINPYDASDTGSIIDFLQNRNKINLGQVRVLLRKYMGEVRPVKDHHIYTTPSHTDRKKFISMFSTASRLKHRDFLHSRAISDKTLDSEFLTNRVGNQVFKTSKGTTIVNTVFPIYNLEGLAGIEKRNFNFKQAEENSDKANGMWLSYFSKENPQIHNTFEILESPIDAISKFQLDGKEQNDLSTIYFSSNGSLNQGHFLFIQYYIELCKPDKIKLCNDNDLAGQRFNANYAGNLVFDKSSLIQNNFKFSFKPVSGNPHKINVLAELHNQASTQSLNNFFSSIQQKGLIVPQPNEQFLNGVQRFNYQFNNDIKSMQILTDEVIKFRGLSQKVEINKPLSKDFNEDLSNSFQKKNKSVEYIPHHINKYNIPYDKFKNIEEFKGEYNGIYQTLWVTNDGRAAYKTDDLWFKQNGDKSVPDVHETKWICITNERYSQITDEMALHKSYKVNEVTNKKNKAKGIGL